MADFHFPIELRDGDPWRVAARLEVSFTFAARVGAVPLPMRRTSRLIVDATIDSGCSSTAVPLGVIDELGRQAGEAVPPAGSRPTALGDRRKIDCPTFNVALRLLDAKGAKWPRPVPVRPPGGVLAIDGANVALVGLDILLQARSAQNIPGRSTGGWVILSFD